MPSLQEMGADAQAADTPPASATAAEEGTAAVAWTDGRGSDAPSHLANKDCQGERKHGLGDVYADGSNEDEDEEAATLLGSHHGKEQLGLSVFDFFKLVSVFVLCMARLGLGWVREKKISMYHILIRSSTYGFMFLCATKARAQVRLHTLRRPAIRTRHVNEPCSRPHEVLVILV